MKKNYTYHLVYKTINLIDGKYYIGKHSTNNLDDGYLGSGKHIKNALLKYGKENFSRTIIKIFDNSEEAWELEEFLVTEEIIKDKNSYNMAYGGKNHIRSLKNNDPDGFFKHQSNAGKKGIIALQSMYTEEEKIQIRKKASLAAVKANRNNPNHPFWNGTAARMGGAAHKNKVELWNPKSLATNKSDPKYVSGDCVRVFFGSDMYENLKKEGWESSKEHCQTVSHCLWLGTAD